MPNSSNFKIGQEVEPKKGVATNWRIDTIKAIKIVAGVQYIVGEKGWCLAATKVRKYIN